MSLSLSFSINLTVSYCDVLVDKFDGGDDLSGAYLFLPDGPAKPLSSLNSFVVIEGPVMKKVSIF